MADLLQKISTVLNEASDGKTAALEILKNNNYQDKENAVCYNCEFYDGESFEAFGACKLALPAGIEDEKYKPYSTGVREYGTCNKFKLVLN